VSRRRPVRRTVLIFAAAIFVLFVAAVPAIRYLEARDRPAQAARLAAELQIRPGMTVAEIGAGSGAMAVEVARIVGAGGQVIATELGEAHLTAIRDAARRANLANITVVGAAEHETNLPADCCDAIYMQRVYHHLTDPAGVIASARRALKPGGRLGVIDFEPGPIRNLWTPRGVPDRGGHGVPKEALVREMRSFGFTLRSDFIAWPEGEYLAVFSAMPAGSNTRPGTIMGGEMESDEAVPVGGMIDSPPWTTSLAGGPSFRSSTRPST
jgi:SAM-dependent methyltransferase